jgi:osmotically-inducible protein OsmY
MTDKAFEGRTDSDIARAAANALKWSTVVPVDRVSIAVSNGWITLAGSVDWQFQKEAAARALRVLRGVRGATNNISVQPRAKIAEVQEKIEAAFKHSAEMDARRIAVIAEGGKIILNGSVRSWAERQEAERAARAAAGVTQVDDRLSVIP